jgi:hypothetical protein
MPLNKKEKEAYNFDKNVIDRFNSQLDKYTFYLGGEIKMKHNDIINFGSIQKVREIIRKQAIENENNRYSWKLSTLYTSQKEIEFIENMIKSYILIMELREKKNHKN